MRARRLRREAAQLARRPCGGSGRQPPPRAGGRSEVSIRSFREGDEVAIAGLYNRYATGFVGPEPLTPRSWRNQFRHQGWSAPSLDADKECVRLALRGRELIGYAVISYRYEFDPDVTVVQELCAAEVNDADRVAEALLADAERLARARGKHVLMLSLSNEDGCVQRATGRAGFDSPQDGGSVFMAAITDLAAFLREIEPELTRRWTDSRLTDWEGTVSLRSGPSAGSGSPGAPPEGSPRPRPGGIPRAESRGGQMVAALRLSRKQVKAAREGDEAAVAVTISLDALPRLLLGQLSVGEAFLQDWLSVWVRDGGGLDRMQALRVLDALFPRLPLWMPRAQWW